MLPVLACSNNIIKKALETETELSHLKLQKLLYLTYARFLHKYGKPLFSEQFEKWQYGPVVPGVYERFKCFGAQSIGRFSRDCNNDIIVVSSASTQFHECLDEVWDKFGQKNGFELSMRTHRDGSAWSKTDDDVGILSQEDIKEDGQKLFDI